MPKDTVNRLPGENHRCNGELTELQVIRDQLTAQCRALEAERESLRAVATGLRIAVDRVADGESKFFSILNADDPINELEHSYGWEVSSDNYFGGLGYYLVISHVALLSGKKIFVTREFEIESLKKDKGSGSQSYIEQVNDSAPILALDYSYFALKADDEASVGGVVYTKDGVTRQFHAPLRDWARALGVLLQAE